jgi:Sugar (and other) transporter
VVTISFLTLLSAIGGLGVFFLFGALTLVALGYFWRRVPETKGRELARAGTGPDQRGGRLADRNRVTGQSRTRSRLEGAAQ